MVPTKKRPRAMPMDKQAAIRSRVMEHALLMEQEKATRLEQENTDLRDALNTMAEAKRKKDRSFNVLFSANNKVKEQRQELSREVNGLRDELNATLQRKEDLVELLGTQGALIENIRQKKAALEHQLDEEADLQERTQAGLLREGKHNAKLKEKNSNQIETIERYQRLAREYEDTIDHQKAQLSRYRKEQERRNFAADHDVGQSACSQTACRAMARDLDAALGLNGKLETRLGETRAHLNHIVELHTAGKKGIKARDRKITQLVGEALSRGVGITSTPPWILEGLQSGRIKKGKTPEVKTGTSFEKMWNTCGARTGRFSFPSASSKAQQSRHDLDALAMSFAKPSGDTKEDTKDDTHKNRVWSVLSRFSRALWMVSELGTKGYAKHHDDDWDTREGTDNRTKNAQARHMLRDWISEGSFDNETDEMHKTAATWNALADLELFLKGKEDADGIENMPWYR